MMRLLRSARWLLTLSAVSLLGYAGFVFVDTWQFQRAEDRKLDTLLLAAPQNAATLLPASLSSAATGSLTARIEVPRLGMSAMVMEGVTSSILRRAAGHIPGTALPGEQGNIGISAHRDTFFRPLRHIEVGDTVLLTTMSGSYRYRVLSTLITTPDDVAVLSPGTGESLTLVTCYPFYFVGPAPNRFVVRAERIS